MNPKGFALAAGYDEATEQFVGLAVPHVDQFAEVTDSTLLLAPDVAKKQRDAESAGAAGGEFFSTPPPRMASNSRSPSRSTRDGQGDSPRSACGP